MRSRTNVIFVRPPLVKSSPYLPSSKTGNFTSGLESQQAPQKFRGTSGQSPLATMVGIFGAVRTTGIVVGGESEEEQFAI